MPTDKSQQSMYRNIFSFLKAREGWPWLPSTRPIFPSYTHLFSNQSLKCVGQLASRISNIKLCHIVFQITLFTVLSFQKNVKDTVIQHNSSFSFLLSTSLKRNSRSRTHYEAWLPLEGSGSLTVHQSRVHLPRATLARTFKCGRSWGLCPLEAKWIWVSRPNFPTQGSLPQDPAPWGPGNAHLLCLQLLVSSWITMAHDISLMPQKPEK